MGRKVIHVELNESSIENAINELKAYRQWLLKKTDEFLRALGMRAFRLHL